jgi:2,5-diamino-6-(ribosylamino)-4(3H)-pyrimidinone 5'-phosphate reductase
MKLILHNSLSLDGSLLGFHVDMSAHYRIAGTFRANVHLVGSNTALDGLRTFMKRLPAEQEGDFSKPKANTKLPLWVVPDSSGKLKGKLHVIRKSGLCRDIVILTSSATPKSYLQHLTERNYDWHYMGNRPLDYAAVMELLAKEYKARTVLVDGGKTLNGILLNSGLVDEISVLVHPLIVGRERFCFFDEIKGTIRLKPLKNKSMNGKCWLHYKVLA